MGQMMILRKFSLRNTIDFLDMKFFAKYSLSFAMFAQDFEVVKASSLTYFLLSSSVMRCRIKCAKIAAKLYCLAGIN